MQSPNDVARSEERREAMTSTGKPSSTMTISHRSTINPTMTTAVARGPIRGERVLIFRPSSTMVVRVCRSRC